MNINELLSNLGIATTIISTIIGSIWAIWLKIIKPALKRKRELIHNREQNAEQMQDALNKLDRVLKEVLPNGGSSLRDSLNRVEKNIDKIESNISNLNEKVDSLEDTHRISLNLQQIAFWISGKQGEITYASQAMCKLVKRVESEMLGNGWISCISHEDTKRISEAWESSVQEGRTFDEVYTFTSNGYSVKVKGTAYHKKDSKGNYIGSYGTLTKLK